MKAKKKEIDFDTYTEKTSVIILRTLVLVSIIANSLDIVSFYRESKTLFFLNISSVSLILLFFFAYQLKFIKLKTSFVLIVYTIIANVFAFTYLNMDSNISLNFFMRDSLIIVILITLICLVSHRIHSVIIAFFYISAILGFNISQNNEFLKSSTALLIVSMIAYVGIINYFIVVLEKAIFEREKANLIVREQNTSLNEVNVLLEERQQRIEEQSEELSVQAEELSDQTVLLKKQSEELTIKNNDLQELNHTKDKFISILAHDLKNPFNILLGYIDLFEMKYDKVDDTKRKEYITSIKAASQKTYTLLLDLLQWARSKTNTLQFDPVILTLANIVNENIFIQKESYAKKGVNLQEDISCELPVFVDVNMINAVLRNLLSNALKFTPTGGTVMVILKIVEQKAVLQIIDTGIGISKERIIDMFKIDSTHSTPGTDGELGTGLGLLICKEFIDKNGGELSVESELNKGTTASITFPIKYD